MEGADDTRDDQTQTVGSNRQTPDPSQKSKGYLNSDLELLEALVEQV